MPLTNFGYVLQPYLKTYIFLVVEMNDLLNVSTNRQLCQKTVTTRLQRVCSKTIVTVRFLISNFDRSSSIIFLYNENYFDLCEHTNIIVPAAQCMNKTWLIGKQLSKLMTMNVLDLKSC